MSAGTQTDRRYTLLVLGLLITVNTLAYADRNLFSVLIPQIKAEFAVSDAMLGILAGPAFVIPYILFSVPVARLGDRWSKGKALALAATVWGAASAACGAAGQFIHLAIARIFVGVGEAGAMPTSQAIVAELMRPERRSAASGALASCTYLGLIIGIAGGGVIASELGWRAAFVALSLPAIILAPLIWFVGSRGPARTETDYAATSEGRSLWASSKAFIAHPVLRSLCLGVGTFHILAYAGTTWIPSYFVRSHGMTLTEAATWLGFSAAIGGFAGSLGGGILADWAGGFGAHWRLRVPAIGQLIAFPVCLVLFLWPGGGEQVGLPFVVIVLTAYCLLSALWAAPAYAAVAELVPEHERAQAIAMLLVGINLIGSIVGPPTAGILSDALTPVMGQEAMRYSLLILAMAAPLGSLWLWKAAEGLAACDTRLAR